MKTIAVIAAYDTKAAEADFLIRKIEERGCHTLLVDVSTWPGYRSQKGIVREMVVQAGGVSWDEIKGCPKNELLDYMTKGATALLKGLYSEGKIQGVIAIGGLQNTIMGATAMQALPIGVPKFVVSTVATGNRTFEFITGTKDITVMPSVVDFAGVNSVSRTILENAAAAITGMVHEGGGELRKEDGITIATTLMGATNDGVVNAAAALMEQGYEVMSFHSTGIGGKTMEELILAGYIDAVMDLTLHEVVYEYFGGGFGAGANNRICAAVQKGIPMVICPAGIDFICLPKGEDFPDFEKRQKIWHNSTLYHLKLFPEEARNISRIIVQRINQTKGPAAVVFPLKGLRSFTREGEALYNPKVDEAILQVFQTEMRTDIPLFTIDANFMDESFSQLAADTMMALLKESKGGKECTKI